MKYRLGDLCSITKGRTGIMKAIPGEYPLVVLGDDRKSHNEYQFDTSAVIVPLVSSTGHGHASMKRVHYQEGKFALGSLLCAVIPHNPDELLPKYLHILLQTNKDSVLVPLMKGMANVSLPISRLADLQIDVPSVNDQRNCIDLYLKVSSATSKISSLIENQTKNHEELRQAILREAMQGKLVPQDPSDEPASELLKRIKAEKAQLIKEKKLKPGKELPPIKPEEIPYPIPDNWVWCRLGELIQRINYGTSMKLDEATVGIPVLRMNNIQNGRISTTQLKFINPNSIDPSLLLNDKDILFNRTNSFELVGKTGLFNLQSIPYSFASYLIRISLWLDYVVPEFIACYMNSQMFRAYIEKDIIQQNGQANFNGTKLQHVIVPLPCYGEQLRISEQLGGVLNKCDEIQLGMERSKCLNNDILGTTLKEAIGLLH